MKIYLDFDGTIVEHQFPDLGKHNEGCFEVIQKLQAAKHEIILNTYRANIDLAFVKDALQYLNSSSIIQPITIFEKKKIQPHPWDWKYFKKNDLIFIDDICEGIPIRPSTSKFPMVDWEKVEREFLEYGIY